MFNVILTRGEKSVVVYANMTYNHAFAVAAHMNALNAAAAKGIGVVVKSFYSVVKG